MSYGKYRSFSESLLHSSYRTILSCIVDAMDDIISNPFQSRLVGNAREPNHLYKTLVW